MTTKVNELLYEYNGITGTQIIDIAADTIGLDDGNTISTTNSSFYIEAIAVSINASNSGSQIRRTAFSYKGGTLAVEAPSPVYAESLGGNAFTTFGVSGSNIRVFLNLTSATSTDVRLFLEIRGYSD